MRMRWVGHETITVGKKCMRVRDHLRDPGVDGRIIIKLFKFNSVGTRSDLGLL